MSEALRPVCLIIMDGLAYGEQSFGSAADEAQRSDAVAAADTPVLDGLWLSALHTTLGAFGGDVGLPTGQMGNSEVGHLNIGAGRIVYQDLTRIDHAIEDGSFFANPVLLKAFDRAREGDATLHLMGLVSDGGVHSSLEHLYALLELAKQRSVTEVAIHAFLDGRDTPPSSGADYLAQLEQRIATHGVGCIATITGRYWAMDRDRRWERVQRAYDALTRGEGNHAASVEAAITTSYASGVTDEFVEPTIIDGAFTPVHDGDSVVFFNFRPDRARELSHALVDEQFDGFARTVHPRVHFVSFTPYDDTLEVPVAFDKETLEEVLGEVLSAHGLRQYRIAETEKYAHVTFFLNGGHEEPYVGEERVLIASPKVATYDLQPEMSAIEVTDTLVSAIEYGRADVYIVNFANGDMVGHTGVFEATRKAVETVDAQIGRIVEAMARVGGVTLITADHGNAEQMLDSDGHTPFTAHTARAVPLIVVGSDARKLKSGSLRDIAPTIAGLVGIAPSRLWTGTDLLVY